jgi:acyl transferase domain-containing protein/acyl carrier protein
MKVTAPIAVAIVGVGAVMPDAPDAPTFWKNIKEGRDSIIEVPPDRWDTEMYFDPDPKAPDMSYSKIGGWVRDFEWDPIAWKMPIPPKVSDLMDRTQKWGIVATRELLADYGYPQRPLNLERTAVILGNAMGGDQHLFTSARALFPEMARAMKDSPSFAGLPEDVRNTIVDETRRGVQERLPDINEDTMPGELANIVAGRIAAVFNFRGPNFTADAACASAMAAMGSALEGLRNHDFDAVVAGGVDSNMAPSIFVKFCKIGALSATGSRPFADGADGFVMGEGAALFLLKRLEDAEREGDKIYAVIRGLGGASDGKGKGITAPNPIGQKLAVLRGWKNAGLVPSAGDMIEGHGTSTAVGDAAELVSLSEAFNEFGLAPGALHIGSVKSNIGHLKGAAGAAGLFKVAMSLHEKVLPPSINFHKPNPGLDWSTSPFKVNTELRDWPANEDGVRRAGVSAFGFGGTNFHLVVEEYVPGRIRHEEKTNTFTSRNEGSSPGTATATSAPAAKAPLRGAIVVGDRDEAAIKRRLEELLKQAEAGIAPPVRAPKQSDLDAPVRVAIDYGDAEELAKKTAQALIALDDNQVGRWKALRAKGIHIGRGTAPKVAFLFTGQGSQYVNMLRDLKEVEPIISETYAEADRVMKPHLQKKLTDYIFVDPTNEEVVNEAHEALKQTEITQPAVLATEWALTRLLRAYGIEPDMVMGHSLGEYGALVASRALPFADGLYAVSARGNAMTEASTDDNGQMAAVWGPIDEIQKILDTVDGYVVVANINSKKEAVIGGASDAVQAAMVKIKDAGYTCVQLQVSHAFHTRIVAAAADSLGDILNNLGLKSPEIPIIANITGDFYPTGPGVKEEMVDILSNQVASPVKFVTGLNRLYDEGVRVFIELGPKRALYGFATDVVGDRDDAVTLFTNHPRIGDIESFNQALCGLYAAGFGIGEAEERVSERSAAAASIAPVVSAPPARVARPSVVAGEDKHVQLGRMFTEFLDRAMDVYTEGRVPTGTGGVVISGASLGLPGVERVFDEKNIERILNGQQFIGSIPDDIREAMADKNILRLVKTKDGEASFETISDTADVIKLAARGGTIDLAAEFGFSEERLPALDSSARLAVAAGIDALRDAGIPLVMHYKTTTKGGKLPDRWRLPDSMRDETGVIFASSFPGLDSFAEQITAYHEDLTRRTQLTDLEDLRLSLEQKSASAETIAEIDRRIAALREYIKMNPHQFDRRFLLRVLAMGHSQFAEYIGARGPNTQTNSACASAGQAVVTARDWINAGRCKRVVVISADNVTTDNLMEWFGAGFVASGAAATDEKVEDAAVPFDRRRHGLIIGMGGAALVLEEAAAVQQRGIQPICELLATAAANSAFHGTRLDIDHMCQIMEGLISDAEQQWGIDRHQIAAETVFVSHETYTPARGGSASAEVHALRKVFGASADKIVMANTKGYTGHPMGVGIEETVAVKILETGIVPPVPNFKEVDPELGTLNLSKGGYYPVRYALRLSAGFGSQISMALFRWIPSPGGQRQPVGELGFQYRVTDPEAWQRWLREATGYDSPEVEIVKRNLRIKDQGPVAKPAPPAATTVEKTSPAPVEKPVAVQPQPAAAETPARPAAKAAPVDPVQVQVMELIAEKSGYPSDMLDMELDMEADLGIDTVKQAEMFAAIRETYDISRDENVKLRDFPTLAHIVQFVYDKRPDLVKPGATGVVAAGADKKPEVVPPAAPVAMVDEPVKQRVMEVISLQTGYPVDMLDPELDLEADLGIDTVKQAEMFAAIREAYNIPRDENIKLRDFPTLAHTIQFVYDRRPDLKPAAPSEAPAPPLAELPAGSAAAVATAAVADDGVKQKVLEVISEQTGYPVDMLDPELDLEADLGIDTVKQAEMFAAIRAAYDIPRDENIKLRDFPTLAHTIQFVYDHRPDLVKGTVVAGTPSASGTEQKETATAAAPSIEGNMEAANNVPRRIPVPHLRPALDLCKKTGVTLGKGSRVLVKTDEGGVGKALITRLEKMGVEVLLLDGAPDRSELAATIQKWKAAGPVQGVFWLPALDKEDPVGSMSLEDWREANRLRVKLLYTTMRELYDHVDGPGTFLVSATRLGGKHGYDEAGAVAPLGGAVCGFTKAFKKEKPEALVKVVDFESSRKTAAYADRLIDETQTDPGVVEVGYKAGLRWTIGLEESPVSESSAGIELNKNSVFVITGAAGSIVSAITADLASSSGGTFHLLDLAPAPDPNDADLQKFSSDRDGLKRDIFERLNAGGQKATPIMVEKELATIERKHAALTAIQAVKNSGGTAFYYSVNLMDGEAVAAAMKQIAGRSTKVDVLLHAAGLEISRLLPDKSPEEFDLVFDVKADGWFNVVSNLGEMTLGAAVVFSSIAGRFGNAGQTDYSSANDMLCKSVSAFRTDRPDAVGIAIDWTAWGGIGMATRGSIPTIMKRAGIDMLDPEAAIPIVRRELTLGGPGETVIAGSLGRMLDEFDSTGGLDTGATGKLDSNGSRGIMSEKLIGMGVNGGLTVETLLDPNLQPFLYDHQINDTPVLPGVMGLEALVEAAKLVFPDRYVGAIENVEFQSPFKFYRGEPRTATVRAFFTADGDDIVARCRLEGSRTLHGRDEPEITEHFFATVRLVTKPPVSAKRKKVTSPDGVRKVESVDIYKLYFHGPAYQVVENSWRAGDEIVGLFNNALPANHQPEDRPTMADPRLIELCFQTAGLFELADKKQMGLPYQIGSVEFLMSPSEAKGRVHAAVTSAGDDKFDARVVDDNGDVFMRLSGYRTMAMPDPVQDDLLKPLKDVME